MPATMLTDNGERVLLNAALTPRLFVRLYRNDVPVISTSLLDDFETALFPGYADREITATWTAAALDATGRAWSRITDPQWTRGAGGVPETVYGYIVYANPSPDSVLVAGRQFTAPVPIDAAGQVLQFSLIAYLLRG